MTVPVTIDPRYYDAVIFDLDGAVTDTTRVDAAAWTQLADEAPVLDSTVTLVRKPHNAGVRTGAYWSGRDPEKVLAAGSVDDMFTVRVDLLSAR